MWWATGLISIAQIGFEFYQCCKKRITIKQFFINSGKILLVNAAAAAGGAAGASIGAAIGSLFGPIGAIIGTIIGGSAGSILSFINTQELLKIYESKCDYSVKRLIQKAL